MENKNNMSISIYAEKALDKFQHHLTLKLLIKIGIKGIFYNTVKATHKNPMPAS